MVQCPRLQATSPGKYLSVLSRLLADLAFCCALGTTVRKRRLCWKGCVVWKHTRLSRDPRDQGFFCFLPLCYSLFFTFLLNYLLPAGSGPFALAVLALLLLGYSVLTNARISKPQAAYIVLVIVFSLVTSVAGTVLDSQGNRCTSESCQSHAVAHRRVVWPAKRLAPVCYHFRGLPLWCSRSFYFDRLRLPFHLFVANHSSFTFRGGV